MVDVYAFLSNFKILFKLDVIVYATPNFQSSVIYIRHYLGPNQSMQRVSLRLSAQYEPIESCKINDKIQRLPNACT